MPSPGTSACIRFAGITVRFVFPTPAALPAELSAFTCADTAKPDAVYEIQLISRPLSPLGAPVATEGGAELYRTEEGWLRIYLSLIAKDGCQVACFLRPNGQNILYYPASAWHFYSAPFHCLHLMCAEAMLLRQDAFLLHSSVVLHEGRTVLFSGPSGAGKSTQADLWAKHLGAEILNGDRCVIRRRPEGFYGCGSPWSGTSRIYRQEQAPIAGIFLLRQAAENRVERLGAAAFPALFTQTTVNSWDTDFMERITRLFEDLLLQIPIYRLHCRPDREAAETAYETLYGRD